MKKTLACLLILFVVITIIAVTYISHNNRQIAEVKKVNQEYEIFKDKIVLGTDVATIINKATNSNEKNNVQKDEEDFFIENDTNSIKVELIMISENESKTYQMETLQKVGLNGFVKNFNLISFKCSKIEYHESTKLVKKIVFEQIEE